MKYAALGVEIERGRSRTWIALAGVADGGHLVVELRPALDGTDAVPAILELWNAHPIDAVGIDPRSSAATLVEGLTAEGMPVQLADATAMAVAFGRFIDWTKSGRLKHRGDRALTEAARQAEAKRSTSGAQSVDRGAHADPAPFVAAELAVWALGDPDHDTQPGVFF